MKQVLKQPLLWISCLCILAAIVIAVVCSVSQPNVPAIANLEKGANKQSLKTMLKAFPPSVQQEIALMGVTNIADMGLGDMGGKVNIIYSEPIEDENGNITVPAFAIINQGGECQSAEFSELDLVEENGKYYLSFY